MADEEKEDKNGKEEEADNGSKKGGMIKKIILGVVVLAVIGGVGAGGYFMGGAGGAKSEAGHEETAEEDEGHGEEKSEGHAKKKGKASDGEDAEGAPFLVILSPVETDLRDTNLKYKVTAQAWVEAVDEESRIYLEQRSHRLVDVAISLLRTKTREELRTVEGRLLLRRQILDTFEQELGGGHIRAVGFKHLKVSRNL